MDKTRFCGTTTPVTEISGTVIVTRPHLSTFRLLIIAVLVVGPIIELNEADNVLAVSLIPLEMALIKSLPAGALLILNKEVSRELIIVFAIPLAVIPVFDEKLIYHIFIIFITEEHQKNLHTAYLLFYSTNLSYQQLLLYF